MPLTRQQEQEIYPLLDRVADLPPGQGILYKCTARRADYLVRMIQGLRYDSAIESILMYPPGHPLHGQGLYALLWVEVQPQGLLVTKLKEPHVSVMWQLIQCAATRQAVQLDDTAFSQARVRLTRAQKKYPEIMNHVFLTDGDNRVTAQYGEPQPEEMIVVDIDLEPAGDIKPPSAQQTAVSESVTPYRKPRK